MKSSSRASIAWLSILLLASPAAGQATYLKSIDGFDAVNLNGPPGGTGSSPGATVAAALQFDDDDTLDAAVLIEGRLAVSLFPAGWNATLDHIPFGNATDLATWTGAPGKEDAVLLASANTIEVAWRGMAGIESVVLLEAANEPWDSATLITTRKVQSTASNSTILAVYDATGSAHIYAMLDWDEQQIPQPIHIQSWAAPPNASDVDFVFGNNTSGIADLAIVHPTGLSISAWHGQPLASIAMSSAGAWLHPIDDGTGALERLAILTTTSTGITTLNVWSQNEPLKSTPILAVAPTGLTVRHDGTNNRCQFVITREQELAPFLIRELANLGNGPSFSAPQAVGRTIPGRAGTSPVVGRFDDDEMDDVLFIDHEEGTAKILRDESYQSPIETAGRTTLTFDQSSLANVDATLHLEMCYAEQFGNGATHLRVTVWAMPDYTINEMISTAVGSQTFPVGDPPSMPCGNSVTSDFDVSIELDYPAPNLTPDVLAIELQYVVIDPGKREVRLETKSLLKASTVPIFEHFASQLPVDEWWRCPFDVKTGAVHAPGIIRVPSLPPRFEGNDPPNE